MAKAVPASVLGLIVSGDLAGQTIYTDRHGRKIHYPFSPPKEPPTQLQINLRARFKAAQAEYMGTTADQKAKWEAITLKTSLCMTGQNLFIHVAMKRTFDVLATLMQQSGVSVNPPTPV